MREHQIRQCIVCRDRVPKEQLVRLVVRAGELRVDEGHRVGGRGVYIHPEVRCLSGKIDERRLARALRVEGLTKHEVTKVIGELLREALTRMGRDGESR